MEEDKEWKHNKVPLLPFSSCSSAHYENLGEFQNRLNNEGYRWWQDDPILVYIYKSKSLEAWEVNMDACI